MDFAQPERGSVRKQPIKSISQCCSSSNSNKVASQDVLNEQQQSP